MSIGKVFKKVAIGSAKIAGSAILGAVGTTFAAVEYLGAGSDIDALEAIGYGIKSASFNGVRKMWGAESKEYDHSAGDAGRRAAKEIINMQEEKREQIERDLDEAERRVNEAEMGGQVPQEKIAAQREKLNQLRNAIRRTDEELSNDNTGTDRPADSYEYNDGALLPSAINCASSDPGVYILWLDGAVMKCGRSSQFGGVRKRLLEYYGLRYDDRAREGDYWAVSLENRDRVVVSWQCCPISKCHELEYKLFKKYGKGPWAQRAPNSCSQDTWTLLI